MAKVAIVTPACTIGGVDYTAQMSDATIEVSGAELDTTNFDSLGWKEIIVGERSGTFSANFKKDSDLSGLDAAMWTAFTGTAAVAVTVKRADSAIATTNPEYQFNIMVTNWKPVAGQVNALFEGSVSWPITGAITRDTTP